jgi:hypothetical protein
MFSIGECVVSSDFARMLKFEETIHLPIANILVNLKKQYIHQ